MSVLNQLKYVCPFAVVNQTYPPYIVSFCYFVIKFWETLDQRKGDYGRKIPAEE